MTWLALLLLVIGAACGGQARKLPLEPPQTLEEVAEQPGPDERRVTGLRRMPVPLRRDACGVPIAVSAEGLMHTQGIVAMQRRLVEEDLLREQAYRPGELDEATLAAVRDFQRRAGLPPVGLPNYATIAALGLELERVFASGEANCRRSSR